MRPEFLLLRINLVVDLSGMVQRGIKAQVTTKRGHAKLSRERGYRENTASVRRRR
jgi:hypothetical protein